jgi:hypothetical protein
VEIQTVDCVPLKRVNHIIICTGFVDKMYQVGAFIGKNGEEVAAFPSSWMTPKRKHCLWPNVGDVTKLAKAGAAPSSSWNMYDVRLIGSGTGFGKGHESFFMFVLLYIFCALYIRDINVVSS